MNEDKLGLFCGEDKPDKRSAWKIYQRGLQFNSQLNLDETVKANENFYVGKQWEGVQANGLPTPQFNILKRAVGFVIATITSDNVKVNVTPLANTGATDQLITPAKIVGEEFDALFELNNILQLVRGFCRNAAVDGDGCLYTYWDPEAETGQDAKGQIKTEIVENTRVFFGNPNSKDVQVQPYIQISTRESVRSAKIRAKKNGSAEWRQIRSDADASFSTDAAKEVFADEKTTVLLTLWRDEESKTIWAYESTENCEIRKPWDLGIRLYPINWLCWDTVRDSYHGQAMVTGLIPNQIFINKAWAMSECSIMKSAFPKVVFDATRIAHWDNRVGGAIPVKGGDVNTVVKNIDPPSISPQVSQFIQMAVDQTQSSLGATAVALGDTRPDNTSAIVALQRSAATPNELTKQNLYAEIENLFRIYMEFMAEYYGTRIVDIETPQEMRAALAFGMQGGKVPDTLPQPYDFSQLKSMPMKMKVDVGASSYYSEIASVQTLDNMLMNQRISVSQYLERIPDSYIPARRSLIAQIKEQELAAQQQAQAMQQMQNAPAPKGGEIASDGNVELPTGRGYSAMQRKLNSGERV